MRRTGLDCGRITGFKRPFVALYHGPDDKSHSGRTQSFIPRDTLAPPYRITRPFCRFDAGSGRIAFDLGGRECWVARDEVEFEKGSLRTRGQATLVSLTLRGVTRIGIWYGPDEEEPAASPQRQASGQVIAGAAPQSLRKIIGLRVKPLRLAVATCVAIFFYLLAGQIDPLGALSAADNYSNILYQQIYRAANYEEVRQREYPRQGEDPPHVVVVELLEDDLKHYDESWPASYDFHAWFLETLAEKKPAAVFIDIAFIDDRSYEGEDWDEEPAIEAAVNENNDPQRFFGGASAYLGEVIADYRQRHEIPLMFAATPCFPPFFLPEDVSDGAGTRALDVPGGRFHREGTRYPLWNHQAGNRPCFEDARPTEEREFLYRAAGETDLGGAGDDAGTVSAPAAQEDGSILVTARKSRRARSLPSAACGVFDAVRRLEQVDYPEALCPAGKLADPEVDELNLHWSTRSFDLRLNDGTRALRNGRYACRELPDAWWRRLLLLLFEFDKDRTFAFRSPLRQVCPPILSFHVGQVLDPDRMLDGTDPLAELEGAVVIYAQNLTGLEDSFTPPSHWPLNGAYFHAMAIDNLLTYRGPERLLQKSEVLGVSYTTLLMLLGFILVVPLWEYGLMLLARVERAGEAAPTRADAFRFYGLWLAGLLFLPVLTAMFVLQLIFMTTFLFPGVALNFIGLLSLIGLRSMPRLWRLMPPLWMGLGGWGRRTKTPLG